MAHWAQVLPLLVLVWVSGALAAMEAMARQPEMIGDLRSSMIIAAALVEGVAFLAVIVALLAVVM